MNRSKLIAIVTGAISLIIATAYLMLVQLLDFRGEMIPAPISFRPSSGQVAHVAEIARVPKRDGFNSSLSSILIS